jgi:hypothetical protein
MAGNVFNTNELQEVCQMFRLLLAKDENTGNYSNAELLTELIQFIALMEKHIESLAQC